MEEGPIETYNFSKKQSLIFHNSYLRLTVERYEIKFKIVTAYLSLYKYKHNQWVLMEFFELIFMQESSDEPDFKKTKYCKIRIRNFYFTTKKNWIMIIDIMCMLYSKETQRRSSIALDTRFNTVSSKLDKIHIMFVNQSDPIQQQLINTYLLGALEKKNMFNENIRNGKRNPFLIFSQFNKSHGNVLSQIDGKGRYSWDLPMTSPIFKILRYLEGSYYLFLYPFYIDGSQTPNTYITKFVVNKLGINLEKMTVGQYGSRNSYALLVGVIFLKHLMEFIIEYTISDISYLQIIFNSVEDSVKLVNDTLSLFRDIYTQMNPDILEPGLLFTTTESLIYLEEIINNYNFDDKFDEIQVIIMNTWCRIFTQVNHELYKSTYEFKDKLVLTPFDTGVLDNRYFYNHYLQNFKDDYIPTVIFKSFFDTLRKTGFMIKDSIDEMDRISEIRDMVSIQNIVNISRIKNFNRCIVFYNDITPSNFRSLLDSDKIFDTWSLPSLSDQPILTTNTIINKNKFNSLNESIKCERAAENIFLEERIFTSLDGSVIYI